MPNVADEKAYTEFITKRYDAMVNVPCVHGIYAQV